MPQMNCQRIIDGVTFRSIQDDRFKTVRICVTFLLPLEEQQASLHALLPNLISRSCQEYPEFHRLNQRLSELYGAALYADVQKIGETHALSIAAVGIDGRFAFEQENIAQQLSELLCQMLFSPKVSEGAFCEEDVKQ